MLKKCLVLLICSMGGVAYAHTDDVVILGLFKDKVVFKHSGKREVLKVGEKMDGIEVISADSQKAVLSIDGKEQEYQLGMQIQTAFQAPQLGLVQIPIDDHGMYRIEGSINSRSVKFLVDTGATAIAMNANQAAELGLDYKKGEETMVDTASGRSKAYLLYLEKVGVGDIQLRDVKAIIVDGSSPKDVLLGMTFLSRVNMKHQESLLVLEQKY